MVTRKSPDRRVTTEGEDREIARRMEAQEGKGAGDVEKTTLNKP